MLLSSSGLSCLEHHFYREAHLNDINCQISCVIYPYYNLLLLCYINIFTGLFVRFIKMKIMTSDGQPRSKNFFCSQICDIIFIFKPTSAYFYKYSIILFTAFFSFVYCYILIIGCLFLYKDFIDFCNLPVW